MSTVYEQLGGEPVMEELARHLYRKMLSDVRVAHFFEGMDVEAQIAKQKAFLSMVTGGPNGYSGRDMRSSHAHLMERGLNDRHVDLLIRYLGEILQEMGMRKDLILQVQEKANTVRDDVLNR
ncbi:group 1 truncated hemoglobin [bacterium]|nr:group 1 truncated hemoglobin [bacterium]